MPPRVTVAMAGVSRLESNACSFSSGWTEPFLFSRREEERVEMPDLLHEDIQWAFTSVILEWKGFGSGYKHVSGGDTDEESRITHVI